MSEITAARPYAKAIFALSNELNTQSEWESFLCLLCSIVSTSEVACIIKDPTYSKESKLILIEDMCCTYIDDFNRNFIKVLVLSGRISLVPVIYKVFKKYMDVGNSFAEITVVVSEYPKDMLKLKYQEFVFRKFGKDVVLRYKVEPHLIGGVMFVTEGKVIDATYRNNLNRLRDFFVKM